MSPTVQYAIDMLDARSAIDAAHVAVAAGITCIEAGHVLIKVGGMSLVAELRRRHPEIELVADMKTMDMGRDEVSVAVDAGADAVIVCAAASDGVLTAARDAAERAGITLFVSLMGVRNRVERVQQLIELGLVRVIAHRGIDDSFHWTDPSPRADLEAMAALPVRLALAGGIGADVLPAFRGIPIDRIIAGRGLSDAPDRAAAMQALLRAAHAHESVPTSALRK